MDEKLDQTGVFQRISELTLFRKQIVFVDSEGSEIEKAIVEVFHSLPVTGRDAQGDTYPREFSPPRQGDARGWETLDMELFSANAERIVREMNEVLAVADCPKEVRSVVLLPEIIFLQTHETIGHPLELDRILGYELAYAGGSFVRLSDFGTLRYGLEKLTVRADATIPNSPGSFGYDDDGVPDQDNLLIDQGLLVGAITGRQMVEGANARARKPLFDGAAEPTAPPPSIACLWSARPISTWSPAPTARWTTPSAIRSAGSFLGRRGIPALHVEPGRGR